MIRLARYKIVRKYSNRYAEYVYIIKERWLCFWFPAYTTEFKSIVAAKRQLSLLVAKRNLQYSSVQRDRTTLKYDEDGKLL